MKTIIVNNRPVAVNIKKVTKESSEIEVSYDGESFTIFSKDVLNCGAQIEKAINAFEATKIYPRQSYIPHSQSL